MLPEGYFLTLKICLVEGGKMPTRGKEGDAGIDVFANLNGNHIYLDSPRKMQTSPQRATTMEVQQFESVKIPLGFAYSFWLTNANLRTSDGRLLPEQVSHDFFLDVRNRSGVGTRSGFVTLAEVGDANYRGVLHYCVAKVTPTPYTIQDGEKIAQAVIVPFVDPHLVSIVQVDTIAELGPSTRGATGFGDSGSK